MKITMKKIAEDLNISKMTVSRYFNGGYVSNENKIKIEEYTKKYNYTPNMLARNLKQKSNIIGFITPKIDSRTLSKVIEGIIEEAQKIDFRVLIYVTKYNSKEEIQAFNELKSLNAVGIIAIATPNILSSKDVLETEGLVVLGSVAETKGNIYYPEDEAILDIINKNKFSKIVYVDSKEILFVRFEIVKKEIEKLEGLNFAHTYIEDISHVTLNKDTLYICATDNIAYKLYRIIKKTEFAIGSDIGVVGYGDYDSNDLVDPPLSSVSYPYNDAGKLAAKMIIEDDFRIEKMSKQLMLRESFK